MSNKRNEKLVPVFNILRSLVDAQIPTLRAKKAKGITVATQIKLYQNQADEMRRFADRCRSYDYTEAREAERDAEEYDSRAMQLRAEQNAGLIADKQIRYANAFYSIYHDVINIPAIAALRSEYDALTDRQSHLIDKMDACVVYHHRAYRSEELCNDMDNDLAIYVDEYEQASQRIDEIKRQLADLERKR